MLKIVYVIKTVVLWLLGTTSSVYIVSLTSDITSSTDIMKSIEPTSGISNNGKI